VDGTSSSASGNIDCVVLCVFFATESFLFLLQICKNPQALVDIFVNYDCDLDSKDVYERMVNDLSKIAQGNHVIDKVNWTPQELKLKTLGLECLVTIVKSMVDWSKELRIEKGVDEEPKTNEKREIEEKEEGGNEAEDDVNEQLAKLEETKSDPSSFKGRNDPDFMKLKEFKLKQARGMAKFKLSAKAVSLLGKNKENSFF
jgi:hypothetical protein